MIDLLFVEVGAVVTEILGPRRCTIEPFCHPATPPTYGAKDRVEVDFARSLAVVLSDSRLPIPLAVAAAGALYDDGSAPIGPNWPGGGYEGSVSIREDVVKANATLAAAVATHPGHPWEYQVVISIDEKTGDVRRYHGFHAEIVKDEGDALLLRVANGGTSANLSSPATTAREVRYDPSDATTFYAGALVAEYVVAGGRAPRSSGAVFITPEAAASFGVEVPKLPPGAGGD